MMKKATIAPLLLLFSISSAFAGFTERKLESAKTSATRSGKNIAFVFYQDFWDPSCPKCVQEVSANNGAIRKAIPRTAVVVVEIEVGDKDMDKLPAAVSAKGKLPRIVVTDAACEKVTAELQGAPDREKSKAFEKAVKEAMDK